MPDDKAVDEAAEHEAKRWADWVKIQEDAGYTVQGTGFKDAVVVELPEGPTYDAKPGA